MICHRCVELHECNVCLASELLHTVHCRSFCLLRLDLLLGLLDAAGKVNDAVLDVVLELLSLNVDECVDFVEFHCWFCWRLGEILLGCYQKSISIFCFLGGVRDPTRK